MNGRNLTRVSEIIFLGNTIRSDLSEKTDVKEKVESLFSSVNTVKYKLKGASVAVLTKLFLSKCAHAYGADTWNFKDRCVNEYWAAWGRWGACTTTCGAGYRVRNRLCMGSDEFCVGLIGATEETEACDGGIGLDVAG